MHNTVHILISLKKWGDQRYTIGRYERLLFSLSINEIKKGCMDAISKKATGDNCANRKLGLIMNVQVFFIKNSRTSVATIGMFNCDDNFKKLHLIKNRKRINGNKKGIELG